MRDSEFVVTWRDWVVSEDRALDRLRRESAFRSFQAMYFPNESPVRGAVRSDPRAPHKLVESRYTRDLLAALARSRHELWHTRESILRADRGTRVDAHTLSGWCEEEREIWKLLSKVAHDGYDWRGRYRLLERANKSLAEDRQIVVKFGRYDETARRSEDEVDETALLDMWKIEHARADKRLKRLAEALNGPHVVGKVNAADFRRWTRAMREHDAHDALPARRRTALCTHNAVVWDKLSLWLCAEEDAPSKQTTRVVLLSQRAFLEELKHAANLWLDVVQGTRPSKNGTAPRRGSTTG